MAKIDLKKQLKTLYAPPPNKVLEVDVPTLNYLMIDGTGDPNTSQAYQESVEALFGLSYTLKFMLKKGPQAIDYGVMPLEGLWWADDMTQFSTKDKSNWRWTMLMMQPDCVTEALFMQALATQKKKKPSPALDRVRFEAFSEGKAAQTMHIGPFSTEGPTIEKVHQFIQACGAQLRGKHHEIYLSDIRKADPAKWKTIIRQPME